MNAFPPHRLSNPSHHPGSGHLMLIQCNFVRAIKFLSNQLLGNATIAHHGEYSAVCFIYAYTHAHTRTHTYSWYTCTCTLTLRHILWHTHIHSHTHIWTHIHTPTHMYTHSYTDTQIITPPPPPTHTHTGGICSEITLAPLTWLSS